jgi:hypothetical protein
MKKRLNLNINPLVALLTPFFVCGKNSVYKAKDFAYRLIQSGIEHQSLEAMFKLTGYLSADRVLDKLHKVSEKRIQRLITNVNKNLKLPKKVILAVDFTEKEYYGDKNHLGIIGSKGGKYVRRYIEVSTVKPALFVNAFPVNQFTNNKSKLLTSLIEGFYDSYTSKVDLLLLDRGFFTKEVVKLLTDRKVKFLMPAVKNKAIVKLVEKFEQGEIPDRIRYSFGGTRTNLLFFKTEEETLIYMTNTRYSPLRAHVLYRKRWQIETNFREQNNFIFKTTTQDFILRYLAFALGGLLFNAWQLTRNSVLYTMESYLFKKVLVEEVLRLWRESTNKEVIKSLDYLLVT